MHLKKVVLRDFRCFEEFEIDLHPRLTVLVAENGGGKTAVLDGIAIGLSSVLRYLSSANQRLSGPGIEDTDFRLELRYPRPQLMLKLGDVEEWGVSDYAQVVIETTAPDLKWDYWRPSATGKLPAFKTGQSDLAAYASGVLDSLNTPTPQLLPVFAYYGARRGWIVIPERLRESKVDYTHPTSALVGALESLSDFKEMLKWFDVEEAAELRANKGRSSEDYDASSALSGVRSAISAILGGAFENPHFNRKHKFVVESQNGSILQVSQLSQGYQSMLAQGMDFARRLALANSHLPAPADAPAIMLVDEIDLHLHPSWQQRVLGDLMRAFPNTQFIVTTHSPQVLSTLRKENIRILACDENGKWTAREPATSPLARESGDALAYVMGTHPRPEIPGILPNIHAYEQLARAGRADSAQARQIKERLDAAGYEFGDAEQDLFKFLAHKAANATAKNL